MYYYKGSTMYWYVEAKQLVLGLGLFGVLYSYNIIYYILLSLSQIVWLVFYFGMFQNNVQFEKSNIINLLTFSLCP